jgi:hypothetical protein
MISALVQKSKTSIVKMLANRTGEAPRYVFLSKLLNDSAISRAPYHEASTKILHYGHKAFPVPVTSGNRSAEFRQPSTWGDVGNEYLDYSSPNPECYGTDQREENQTSKNWSVRSVSDLTPAP